MRPVQAVKGFMHNVSEALKMDKSEEKQEKHLEKRKSLTPAEHELLAQQCKYTLQERGVPFSDLGSRIVITSIEKA